MTSKKILSLMLLLFLVFYGYAADGEDDVKVPVNLNNRLKGMNQNFSPKFSPKLDSAKKIKKKQKLLFLFVFIFGFRTYLNQLNVNLVVFVAHHHFTLPIESSASCAEIFRIYNKRLFYTV